MAACGAAPAPSTSRWAEENAITAEVKARLDASGDFGPVKPDVDTNRNDGQGGWVVTLQGQVENQALRAKAETLARGVRGVTRVITLLKVAGQER